MSGCSPRGRGEGDFESLTRPLVGALWRVALRMTGNREEADDLTQEACLRAYRAFDRFEKGTNYKAWIFRIMTNLCSDVLRRRARSPIVALREESDSVPCPAAESDRPDAQLIRKSFLEDLSRAMERLAPEVRLVVSLALLKELSYQEIAEIADCPVGTVRSRLSRGRQQLQQELKDYVPSSAPSLKVVAGGGAESGRPR